MKYKKVKSDFFHTKILTRSEIFSHIQNLLQKNVDESDTTR